ncbi:hypothetical protein [Piscinibacter sakaiensis]|uniref:hypothetical protein n=1 Tax=Piscinibacter sakaiensis TaxID=1547922 RepID=UPI003AB09AD9
MRNSKFLIGGLAAAASLVLAGCDVEKTQEGNVTLPKYEVEKTQEGSVTVPKYDVTTPDVVVGTTKKEVEVPTVTTETKVLDVPTVGIVTAEEKKKQEELAQKK